MVLGQLSKQGVAQYGNAVALESVNTGTTPTRKIHAAQALDYFVKVTAGASAFRLILPYDVRNLPTGIFAIVWCDAASTRNVTIETISGSVQATVTPGTNATVILRSNATAAGTWFVSSKTTGPRSKVS